MEKKIVIAGTRTFTDYAAAKEWLDVTLGELLSEEDEPIVLSGKCRGGDALGERYAAERGWRVIPYPANWALGKIAGPMRNRRMAEDGDIVLCFWDGVSRGTASLIRFATERGRTVRIYKV